MEALALGTSSPQPGHVGFGPRFVQEDQAGRIQSRLLPNPAAAGPADVGAVLFAGPENLFLYVRPIRSRR